MNEQVNTAARMIAKENSPKSQRAAQVTRLGDEFPVPDKDSILVSSVGGVGQIGMNWTLYGYDGRWILVDAGSAFAPRDINGVEAIFPDPASLASILPLLDALIVTHAHEDHIGAIHRLWPQIKCPILATPFAAEVLMARFAEKNTQGDVKIKVFNPGDDFRINGFHIQSVRMTHSVPECVALAFNTEVGTVFHTGDWKFDQSPVVGRPTDTASLRRIGDAGVMAMVCDSTNATRRGKPTSEKDLETGMTAVFRDTDGMVAVACFATNVARMATIVRAAASTGRQVAISGRSLIKTEAIARKLGMLEGVPPILQESTMLKGLYRSQMALICTGAQGEERAAFSRLSVGDNWRLPKVRKGDAVIHSARAIPGNEDDINRVFDRFREQGATVHQGEYMGLPLHVTGHAVANELERMYGYIRPQFAIPVHGEEEHLEAHARIANRCGVSDVVIPREGLVFRVTKEGVTAIAEVEINLVADLSVSDGTFVEWDEELFRHIQETEKASELDEIFEEVGIQRMVA